MKQQKALTLKTLTKGNVWEVQENDIFRLLDSKDKDSDFTDLWWVGDYSEVNEDGAKTGKAGFIAVHMMNSLSTGGYAIQSSDKAKGQFSFEFTGHYSMDAPEKVPFEIHIKQGTADAA